MIPRFRTILLKISGEIFSKGEKVIHGNVVESLSDQIKEIHQAGVKIGLVIGGGNILRGSRETSIERVTADHMGMLATVINALALQSALEKTGLQTRVMTAFEVKNMAEPYIRRRAVRHFEKNRVVIFAGGTGNPYFTTDTSAALKAAEMNADVVLKATNVDGVYDSDPKNNPHAERFESLKYIDVLQKKLRVMDSTAISFCMENTIPILVFDIFKDGNLKRIITGECVGTYID